MKTRWKTVFVDGGFKAQCSLCKRITTAKHDLAHCPHGCEKEVERLDRKVKAAKKKAAPVHPSLFDTTLDSSLSRFGR